jgi:catechol 2,3-dioxygenase-like lactoylglutathione lyase family enzyme
MSSGRQYTAQQATDSPSEEQKNTTPVPGNDCNSLRSCMISSSSISFGRRLITGNSFIRLRMASASTAAPPVYSDAKGYKDRVVGLFAKTEFPVVVQEAPVVNSLRFHHIGVVCRDPAASVVFYTRLGFKLIDGDTLASRGPGIVRLGHQNGLELHLIVADAPPSTDEPFNILMDTPATKYPGHTHCSWSVPSVPGVKKFLEASGVPLSGTRSTLAVFVRDVDRTTLELERK